MKAFLSHNKADKESARAIAKALLFFGVEPWFDEWDVQPGDSIIGGIEQGITGCDIFILIWSRNAASSRWVGTELRAFVRRRVEKEDLKIIPIMMDETPLPALVAEYRGFDLTDGMSLSSVASAIGGDKPRDAVVRLLHSLLLDKTYADRELSRQPLALLCERCYSVRLRHGTSTDETRDDIYYWVCCDECGWEDSTEI